MSQSSTVYGTTHNDDKYEVIRLPVLTGITIRLSPICRLAVDRRTTYLYVSNNEKGKKKLKVNSVAHVRTGPSMRRAVGALSQRALLAQKCRVKVASIRRVCARTRGDKVVYARLA